MERRPNRLTILLHALGSTVLDSLFLSLWVGVQWLFHEFVLGRLPFSGVDQWALVAAQLVFSLGTLGPIALYVYEDIAVALFRTRARVQHEKRAYAVESAPNAVSHQDESPEHRRTKQGLSSRGRS